MALFLMLLLLMGGDALPREDFWERGIALSLGDVLASTPWDSPPFLQARNQEANLTLGSHPRKPTWIPKISQNDGLEKVDSFKIWPF